MPTRNKANSRVDDSEVLRAEWLTALKELATKVKNWAEELNWSTRQIAKKMKDSRLGEYEAPALLMQKETTRVLLDPVARFAPGADGVVDLYLMPAYDDIASLYFVDGEWQLHYMFHGTDTVPTIRQAEPCLLSKDVVSRVLDEMTLFGDLSNDSARIAGRENPLGDIASDHAPGANDGFRADTNARTNDGASADPYV
jgi:hypothetical protein